MAKKATAKKSTSSRSKNSRSKSSTTTPATTLSAKEMEAWHKGLARATGMLSLTLARRRRPLGLIDDMLNLIDPVVDEMRKHR